MDEAAVVLYVSSLYVLRPSHALWHASNQARRRRRRRRPARAVRTKAGPPAQLAPKISPPLLQIQPLVHLRQAWLAACRRRRAGGRPRRGATARRRRSTSGSARGPQKTRIAGRRARRRGRAPAARRAGRRSRRRAPAASRARGSASERGLRVRQRQRRPTRPPPPPSAAHRCRAPVDVRVRRDAEVARRLRPRQPLLSSGALRSPRLCHTRSPPACVVDTVASNDGKTYDGAPSLSTTPSAGAHTGAGRSCGSHSCSKVKGCTSRLLGLLVKAGQQRQRHARRIRHPQRPALAVRQRQRLRVETAGPKLCSGLGPASRSRA